MRKLFVRMPIFAGNVIQVAGLGGALLLLNQARAAQSTGTSLAALFAGWLLLYFCCHAVAHWLVGRLLGIRFSFYTVGGTANRPVGLVGSDGFLSVCRFSECRPRKHRCSKPRQWLKQSCGARE